MFFIFIEFIISNHQLSFCFHVLLVLEGLLQRRGVAVTHRSDRDTGSRSSGKYSLVWALLESQIFFKKKRNGVLIHTTTCMDLENFMLSKKKPVTKDHLWYEFVFMKCSE